MVGSPYQNNLKIFEIKKKVEVVEVELQLDGMSLLYKRKAG